MSNGTRWKTGMRCPNCGEAELKTRFVSEKYEYDVDEGGIVVESADVPIDYCVSCGESYIGPEAARICHDALVRALGFLMPAEIRGIRERIDKTQADFAKLTGVGEATLSRWERGRLIQNRANDRYLRVLASVPEAVRFSEIGLPKVEDGADSAAVAAPSLADSGPAAPSSLVETSSP